MVKSLVGSGWLPRLSDKGELPLGIWLDTSIKYWREIMQPAGGCADMHVGLISAQLSTNWYFLGASFETTRL